MASLFPDEVAGEESHNLRMSTSPCTWYPDVQMTPSYSLQQMNTYSESPFVFKRTNFKFIDDLTSSWWEHLKENNELVKAQCVHMNTYLVVAPQVVEIIFLTSNELLQSPEVRYLAVEIFDRFTSLQFKDISARAWSNKNIETCRKTWAKVLARIKAQTLLRVLSCIQLASKFLSNNEVLSARKIQKFLKEKNKPYTLNTILASEIRVFRTLNYKVNIPTRYDYVGFMIEQVYLRDELDRSKLHKISVSVTDIVYLHHQEIYLKLFYLSTGSWERTRSERLEFLPTECNLVYSAASIVISSISFVQPDDNAYSEEICKQLEKMTDIQSDDITGLASVITQIIFT